MPYRCQICKDCSDIEDVYQSDRDYPSDISDSDTEFSRRRWRRRHSRRTYQHRRGSETTSYTGHTSERDQRRGNEKENRGKYNSRTYRRRNYWTSEGRENDNNYEFRSDGENYGRDRERYINDFDDGNEMDMRSELYNQGKENAKGRGQTSPICNNGNGRQHSTTDNESNSNSNIFSPDKVQEANTDKTFDNKTEESESDSPESSEKNNQDNKEENNQGTEDESDYTTDSDSFWKGSSDLETDTDTESDDNDDENRDAAQILVREKRNASYQSRGNHGGYRSSRGRAKSRKRRSLSISYVKMPSGKRSPVITPKIKEFKCGTPTKRITLHRYGRMSGKEYKLVEKEMQNSIVHHQNCANAGGCFNKYEIVKIEKLINGCQWKRYRHAQKDIINEHGYANQRMVFHGSAKVEDIIETGFDERYSNLNGMFGAGLYFAKHSSKANQYAFGYMGGTGCPNHQDKNCHSCERKILLCRVTLGRSKNVYTAQNFAHPPAKYNSVVGLPSKSKGGLRYPEYIVYRGEQVYPDYMITYKIKD